MATMQLRHKIFMALKGTSYAKIAMAAIDQLSHFWWGAGISAVATMFGMTHEIGLIVLPMLSILPRELVDQWPIEKPLDSIIDTISFGVGGLFIAGLLRIL